MELDKALFLDLDGTIINTRSGRQFPLHSADWVLIPETLEAIKHYYRMDYRIIIVTNQGGIEQGYIAEKVFVAKIEEICKVIEKHCGLRKNSIIYSYCPKMENYYRKPNPGMAYELAIEYELNLRESVMIGDMITDNEFAIMSGIGTYIDIEEVKITDWSK